MDEINQSSNGTGSNTPATKTTRKKPSTKQFPKVPNVPVVPSTPEERAEWTEKVAQSAAMASRWIMARQLEDGHWCAELESNATITAEYVFMCQGLKIAISDERKERMVKYLSGNQKQDGSWGIAYNYPGDVSTTVEVYFALRLLGLEVDHPTMKRAEVYIRDNGGVEKVRIFTRINLACFGLWPWEAIPVIPPEFIFLPPESPVNVYTLSSWARSTMVPLFIIFHHKPVFELPNGQAANNDWLDHLWLNPSHKNLPYCESWIEILQKEGVGYRTFFSASDQMLRHLERVRDFARNHPVISMLRQTKLPVVGAPLQSSIRELAVKKCEEWILERQEKSGDWAGIFPPMVNGVIALCLNGHSLDSDPVRRGLEAIERFAIDDAVGFRVQACVSPVWDTVLSMRGLIDCGSEKTSERMDAARKWVDDRQLRVNYGDWKVYNPNGVSGGWSFEYENSWYPDVDDTAAVMLAFLKQRSETAKEETITRAAQWVVSMQNRDGGWGAFDKDNDKLFLNKIPFSDMDSLCDPSSPDVTGRVLEAFGVLKQIMGNEFGYGFTANKALRYLRATQETEGSWYGRWGVNYVYGTSNVLCGLVEWGIGADDEMVVKALEWLKSKQNEDGGWGEKLESYADKSLMGIGPSTASQTAWAVMGLLAYLPASDEAVHRGIKWLVDHQVEEQFRDKDPLGTWAEKEFTGTGFPNHFYLRYHYYRHFFPMMALGRYLQKQVQ